MWEAMGFEKNKNKHGDQRGGPRTFSITLYHIISHYVMYIDHMNNTYHSLLSTPSHYAAVRLRARALSAGLRVPAAGEQ